MCRRITHARIHSRPRVWPTLPLMRSSRPTSSPAPQQRPCQAFQVRLPSVAPWQQQLAHRQPELTDTRTHSRPGTQGVAARRSCALCAVCGPGRVPTINASFGSEGLPESSCCTVAMWAARWPLRPCIGLARPWKPRAPFGPGGVAVLLQCGTCTALGASCVCGIACWEPSALRACLHEAGALLKAQGSCS